MNLQELKESGMIIFEHIRGSHMFGTNIATSDVDIGGLFRQPNDAWLDFFPPAQDIADEKRDVSYMELRKYLELAQSANPTVLETMFCPEDCIKIKTPVAEELLKHRLSFITKKCYYSFTGYAHAQIQKAKGKNKKVHNTDKYMNDTAMQYLKAHLVRGDISIEWVESRFNKYIAKYLLKNGDVDVATSNTNWKEMDKILDGDYSLQSLKSPRREDFCYHVDFGTNSATYYGVLNKIVDPLTLNLIMPFRPNKLDDVGKYDISAVEHIPFLFRLYRNGTGIFKDNQMVFTSIPIDREWKDFDGILYFNENEYDKAKAEYLSFWEWMSNRNENRWADTAGNQFDYDHKNMQHCCRLILSAEHIVDCGEPLVRLCGDQLKFIRGVRAGEFDYEYLINFATSKCTELKEKFDKCSLPHGSNTKKIRDLYKYLVMMENK